MVLNRPFRCLTRVVQGHAFDEALAALLGERRWALITSAGWLSRGIVDRLEARCGAPEGIVADVESTPKVATVVRVAQDLPEVEAVVALGGGSVIDAAKGAVALCALGHDFGAFNAHLRDGESLPDSLVATPIVAVPTTSGTGSEVTCWGTIWGEEGIKHSVWHGALYPSDAVLDPALCTSMPRDLTVSTALDSLSHAMESVWNRSHTDVTDSIAAQAIGILRAHLSDALAAPDDVSLRQRIQTASLLAGLSMGTTQTAIAHSISYPFTAQFDVPHGLACSFTLPEIARYNMETDPDRLAPIAAGLGCTVADIPETLEVWFDELGVGALLNRYVTADVANSLDGSLLTRSRASNNIRDVDNDLAQRIVGAAMERFCDARALDVATNR